MEKQETVTQYTLLNYVDTIVEKCEEKKYLRIYT